MSFALLVQRPSVMAALLLTAVTTSVLVPPPAEAATFVVTANRITNNPATDDPTPDGCASADCSLREAVLAANASAGADLITFASSGTVRLGIAGPDVVTPGTAGDLDVIAGEDLSLVGPVIIDATSLPTSSESRIFEVTSADLSLDQVTLQSATTLDNGAAVYIGDGTLSWIDGSAFDNDSALDGGVVYLASSGLVLDGVNMIGNGASGSGGAIGTDDYSSMTISNSRFEANEAGKDLGLTPPGGDGGAVNANAAGPGSTMGVTQSSFVDNAAVNPGAPSRGGAIATRGGTATMTLVEISDNGSRQIGTTGQGGGISTDSTLLTITDATISGNAATDVGGGLALLGDATLSQVYLGGNQVPAGLGGGVYVIRTQLALDNSTIDANQATQGAGVHIGPNVVATLRHDTLTSQLGPALSIEIGGTGSVGSSLIALNTVNCDVAGTLTSTDYNLEDADTCGFAMASDLVNTGPVIGPAQDNGGNGQGRSATVHGFTRALLPGGPAIDSADPALCGTAPFNLDQRSIARPQGMACDRGAFEAQPVPDEPTEEPTPEPEGCQADGAGGSSALEEGLTRIEGLNRIQTAIAASTAVCGDEEAPAVVLTRSDLFPDAQAGTPLAIALGAPLLLSSPTELSADTEDEIVRVLAPGGTVYLLGGTAALAEAVQDRVEELGFDTVRYGGADRFDTAQIIAGEGLDDPATILLTNGGVFADSVLAGAAASTFRTDAGAVDAAVLLTSGENPSPFTEDYLSGRDDEPELIAIGTAASQAYPDIEAVSGPTRFETSVAVADRFFTDPTIVGIARGDEFADALSGGALVGRSSVGPGPMLLVASDSLPATIGDWLGDHAATIDRAVIFGGEAAINAEVESDIRDVLGF